MNQIPSYFDQIPNEVVLYIASYLSPEELILFGRTCKILYQVSEDNALWRLFFMQNEVKLPQKGEDAKLSLKQIFSNSIVTVDQKIQLLKQLGKKLELFTNDKEHTQLLNYFQHTLNSTDIQTSHPRKKEIYTQFLTICNSTSERINNSRDVYPHIKHYSILEKLVMNVHVEESERNVFERILEDLILQEINRVSEIKNKKNAHVTFELDSLGLATVPYRIKYNVHDDKEAKSYALILLDMVRVSDIRPENLAIHAEKMICCEGTENNSLLFMRALWKVIKKTRNSISLTLEKCALTDSSIPLLINIILSEKCSFLDLSQNMFTVKGRAFLVIANHNNPSCKLLLAESVHI